MKHLEPKDAHAFLQSHPEAVFIDCRSEIEYLFVGHPVGAIHIAWQDSPDWDVNPNFLGQTRRAASVNRPVVLICRSGRRSVDAGGYLERHGFPEIYNVLNGFEGDMDEHHHRSTTNGWRFDGLPWEQT
jgi:rhodanese-related sulfurtransferase